MNIKLSAGKFIACDRAQKKKMDNRTITDEINDELIMSFILVLRCLYAKKLKSHVDPCSLYSFMEYSMFNT